MDDQQLITVQVLADDKEHAAYFSPYEIAGKHICGAARKRCSKCNHRYRRDEYNHPSCPECGDDRRCKLTAEPGRDRCKWHGGRTLQGEASPSYKHGRSVKTRHGVIASQNPDLAKLFKRAYESTDMHTLVGEVAILESCLLTMLKNLNVWLTAADITKMMSALRKADKCFDDEDEIIGEQAPKARDSIHKAFEVLEGLSANRETWSDAIEMAERVAALKRSQAALEKDRSATLSASEAVHLIDKIFDASSESIGIIKDAWKAYKGDLNLAVNRLRIQLEDVSEDADLGDVLRTWMAEIPGIESSFAEAGQQLVRKINVIAGR